MSLRFNLVKCNGYHKSYSYHSMVLEARLFDDENIYMIIHRSKKTFFLVVVPEVNTRGSTTPLIHHTDRQLFPGAKYNGILFPSAVDMRGFTVSVTMFGGFYGSENIHMNTRTRTGFNSRAGRGFTLSQKLFESQRSHLICFSTRVLKARYIKMATWTLYLMSWDEPR